MRRAARNKNIIPARAQTMTSVVRSMRDLAARFLHYVIAAASLALWCRARSIPRREARASASFTFDETLIVELSASSVGSQFPVDPTLRAGPSPGGSRLGLLYVRRNLNRRVVGLERRLAIPSRSHTSCGSLAGRLAPRPPLRSTKP